MNPDNILSYFNDGGIIDENIIYAPKKPKHSKKSKERVRSHARRSMRYHIDHFINRINSRFGVNYDENDYYRLLDEINENKSAYFINTQTRVIYHKINGQDSLILIGKSSKFLPMRLKTILNYSENHRFLVPDALRKFYDNYTFTDKIREIIKIGRILSTCFSLDDKRGLFTDERLSIEFKKLIHLSLMGYDEHQLIHSAMKILLLKHNIRK